MKRTNKIIGFLLVTMVGAWGCSKVPTGNASADKNPSLEAKVQRLEEDFRAAAAARDQFRLKMLAAEEKLTAAENTAGQLQRNFDETRTALAAATTERDTLATQYEMFRKNIKSLLGQAENALNTPASPPNQPVTLGTPTPIPPAVEVRN
jgi:chromosome segregation ATPase